MWLQDIIDLFKNRASDFVVPWLMALLWLFVWYLLTRYAAYIIRKRIVVTQIENDVYANKIWWIISSIVMYIWWTFNVLIAFQIIGLNVGILMAWISFGIWFAMQQILENMMAGFLILTNSMYKVWEAVKLLGDFNTFGRIEALQSRYTIIREFTGKKLIIPNTIFLKTPIQTFKRESIVRGDVAFTIEHHIPIDKLQVIMTRAINQHVDLIQKEKTSILPDSVNGSGTNFKIYFFINPQASTHSLFVIKSDLRKVIMKTLNAYKITVPYPKQILDFT